jgi:hypothetical protein
MPSRNPGYGVGQLRNHPERFSFPLSGNDRETLFGPPPGDRPRSHRNLLGLAVADPGAHWATPPVN